MKITFLGHASLLIEVGGKRLVVDPFITPNPKAKHLSLESLKPDYVLITHGHNDHVYDAEALAKLSGATLISNYEIVSWFEQKGVPGYGMNFGGTGQFDFGTLKYVYAAHSSQLPDGSYGGNPGGFVISDGARTVYVAGDTSLTQEMKLLPLTGPKIDLAVLPIGDTFTMGYQDAAFAAEFVECTQVLGCHFDTFPPIEIDHQRAVDHFASRGLNLHLLEIGGVLEV